MFVKILLFFLVAVIVNSISVAWGKEINRMSKGFGLTIVTDKATYRAEEPITITLVIFNYTKDTLRFSFSSSQRYDFFIKRDGEEIWRWSTGRVFAQVMGTEKVESGESLVYTKTYRAKEKLTPGIYTITGILTCRDPLKTLEGTVCIQVSKNLKN